jgi:hypothetical protein
MSFIAAVPYLLGPIHIAIIHRHDVDAAAFIVDAAEYPALVDLLSPGDCLGTLIASEWLLTAAHCAEHLREDATFEVGSQTVGMTALFLHDDYDGVLNDIGLVQLDEVVSGVDTLSWYTAGDETGQEVLFVGRGDSGTGVDGQRDAVQDGQTRQATNTIEDIQGRYLQFTFHSPDDARVTEFEGISGDGDSGGPALVATGVGGWAVAGLSSYQDRGGHRLGTYGVEEFYTRVSDYDGWIERGLNGELEPDDPKGCASVGSPSRQGWVGGLFLLCILLRRSKSGC